MARYALFAFVAAICLKVVAATPDPVVVPDGTPMYIMVLRDTPPGGVADPDVADGEGTYSFDVAARMSRMNTPHGPRRMVCTADDERTAIGATRYFYDAHQRLSGWSTSLPTLLTTATIGYDTFGNRLYSYEEGCTMNGGAPSVCWSPSYQASELRGTTNHYLHLSYDSAGNVTADATRTFEYDALGMMTRALVGGRDFRYLYTPGGERIAAVERANVAGTIENRITYTVRGFENQLLSVWKSGAAGTLAWSEDLIWRGNALLANETPSGTRHTILDHLGSPRLLAAGATGLAVGTQSFQPFGEGGTLDAGPLQFTAHERDAALFGHGTADLPDYMHARFYDGGTGRFMSVDPGRDSDMRQPHSWNMYAYVRNNPVGSTDPDGRQAYKEVSDTYLRAADTFQPVADVLKELAPFSGAAAITNLAVKTLGLGTATGTATGSNASPTKLTLAISKDVATASEAFVALAGASSPLTATRSTIPNLGGTGEVVGSNVVNVQPATIGGDTGVALRHAVETARSSGQRVVMAHGDALPFQTGSVRTVVTNNVPIDRGFGYFGRSFTSSEIQRILAPLGRWFGSSAP